MYCIYSDHQRDRVVVCSTLVAFALSDSWTAFHVVHGHNSYRLADTNGLSIARGEE